MQYVVLHNLTLETMWDENTSLKENNRSLATLIVRYALHNLIFVNYTIKQTHLQKQSFKNHH